LKRERGGGGDAHLENTALKDSLKHRKTQV